MSTSAVEKPKVHPSWYHLLRSPQLAKLGVKVINRFALSLECKTCKEQWTPQRHADGRLIKGYWRCPNRCNW